MTIKPLSSEDLLGNLTGLSETKTKNKIGASFKNLMVNSLKSTNDALISSKKASDDFILGKETDIHKVMISMEKAQVAMQFTIQIRNKLVEGFQEIMRMQV
jgi:flagellar hook-basal body complex protein FliE